jgi:phosphoribosylaminoimidazole (AIR) synthetase
MKKIKPVHRQLVHLDRPQTAILKLIAMMGEVSQKEAITAIFNMGLGALLKAINENDDIQFLATLKTYGKDETTNLLFTELFKLSDSRKATNERTESDKT